MGQLELSNIMNPKRLNSLCWINQPAFSTIDAKNNATIKLTSAYNTKSSYGYHHEGDRDCSHQQKQEPTILVHGQVSSNSNSKNAYTIIEIYKTRNIKYYEMKRHEPI